MVYIVQDCHCEICPGDVPAKTVPGQFGFGGQICNCRCHKCCSKEKKA